MQSVERQRVAVVLDGVEPRCVVVEHRDVVIDVGLGPRARRIPQARARCTVVGARPRRIRRRTVRALLAREHRPDELDGVAGPELVGLRLALEPPAVDAPGRPHGRERVDERQLDEAVGMIDRRLERDDAAPVVTDEVHLVEAERVEELDHVVGEDVAGDADARLVGEPVAACRARRRRSARRARRSDGATCTNPAGIRAPATPPGCPAARVAIVHPQARRVDEVGRAHRAGMYFAKSTWPVAAAAENPPSTTMLMPLT